MFYSTKKSAQNDQSQIFRSRSPFSDRLLGQPANTQMGNEAMIPSDPARNKKEKSIAENILVVILLVVLMGSFVEVFFKQEQEVTDGGFYSMKSTFTSKIMMVHAQWFIDTKPSSVKIKQSQDQQISYSSIPVNHYGWVDVTDKTLRCEKIWQFVMDMPLVFMKKSIVAIQINKASTAGHGSCRYQLSSSQFFDYDSASGRVE